MPFLVLNELKPSDIHGLGVFAAENIKEGTVVFKHDAELDGWFDNKDYNPALNSLIQKYCPYDSKLNKYIKACDNVNWMNHSDQPNLSAPTYYIHIANKDILIGEELTVNYNEVSDTASWMNYKG
jgi:SET domain-containing protein